VTSLNRIHVPQPVFFGPAHFGKLDLLSAQSSRAVPRPDLVGFYEWGMGTIGDHDIVQRESAQKISSHAANVYDPVTISLNQSEGVPAASLASPIGVGDEKGCTEQQQCHHRDSCEEARQPPTH